MKNLLLFLFSVTLAVDSVSALENPFAKSSLDCSTSHSGSPSAPEDCTSEVEEAEEKEKEKHQVSQKHHLNTKTLHLNVVYTLNYTEPYLEKETRPPRV